MAALPVWLQRWNFIERAKLERELWDAFERRENIEALVARCAEAVQAGDDSQAFRLDVWRTTLQRIRRIEQLMADQPQR